MQGRADILSVNSGFQLMPAPWFRRLGGCLRPLAVLASCVCAACALGPKPDLPALETDPLQEVPAQFAESTPAGAYEPLEWWRAFGDPVLDELVETALASNFDMAEAVARVEQARETALLAKAAIFPVVGARASVDDFRSPTNAGIGAQVQELGLEELLGAVGDDFALPDRLGLTNYALSADVAYEFDFWGRVRSTRLAAGADYLASESDLQAVRIGILSETVAAYFEIVDLRQRMALTHEMVEVLLEREDVAATRYDRGLADSLDLYRVRQELRDTQAGLPQLERRLAAAEARLAVLLGGYREELDAILPAALSPAPPPEPVPAGIPADLLLQRPDVRAARHRLAAAGYAIQARLAELRPTLSLSGSIGLQSARIGSWFNVNQWFTNLAANLLEPVFDGGRRETRVALAEARFNELAAAYGRTVVTAVNEVGSGPGRARERGPAPRVPGVPARGGPGDPGSPLGSLRLGNRWLRGFPRRVACRPERGVRADRRPTRSGAGAPRGAPRPGRGPGWRRTRPMRGTRRTRRTQPRTSVAPTDWPSHKPRTDDGQSSQLSRSRRHPRGIRGGGLGAGFSKTRACPPGGPLARSLRDHRARGCRRRLHSGVRGRARFARAPRWTSRPR